MDASLQPPEQIETERLLLQRAAMECAQSLFDAYASDPDATRYLSWPTHESIDDTRGFLKYAVSAWEEGSDFIWTIEPREIEAPVGTLSFSSLGHRAQIGFVISRGERNKGYMTEATRSLVRWLLEQPSVLRIEALCDIENLASQRVLEKVGLDREGTLRRWMVLPNLSYTPRDMYMYSKVVH